MPQYENPFARPSHPASGPDTAPVTPVPSTLTLERGPEVEPAPLDPVGGSRVRRVLLGETRGGRLFRVGVVVLVVALVAGAMATWAFYDRTVTVVTDGQAQDVRIFGTEVSDALAAAGVEVSDRDLVSPGAGDTIADGGTVTVRYARDLRLMLDGQPRLYVTHEQTLDAAIEALGLRLDGAALSVSRSTPIGREGLDVDVVTPKDVVVVLAGVEQAHTSTARTVGDLLADLGVAADADDIVSPAPDTVVSAGLRVTYDRIEVREVQETTAIPAPRRTVDDDDLYVGQSEVVEEGSDGIETITYSVTLRNGVEESRVEVARAVTTEPVERVVSRGTTPKPPPAPSGSTSSSSGDPAPSVGGDVDSLNWAALAQCESGGDPTIVSSNGLYHGLYQFDVRTWQSVGGSGVASQAPAGEQTYRAKLLYQQRGAAPWPTCGRRLFS